MSNLTKAEFKKPGADQWVYIATPAHTIHSNFHVSLIRTIPLLLEAGISVTYAHLAGHCHVDDARNLLVADFLKSGATDLLFWDADVACQADGALKLLRHDVDVVGGVYPLKDGTGKFPVKLLSEGRQVRREDGLVIARALPTGFLRIRRVVLSILASHSKTALLDGEEVALIFERSVSDGNRVGGDYTFSMKAMQTDVQLMRLFADPSLMFTHQGAVDFSGRLADHLQ